MSDIQYRFMKMDLTQFSPEWDRYDSENQEIGIESNFNFSYNKENMVLRCTANLNFIQKNQIFLKTELQTFFDIAEETVEKLTKDGQITLPRSFLCQCASLAYGSFRGVIYMKTINTALNNLILPPMYLNEVIKDDMIIQL